MPGTITCTQCDRDLRPHCPNCGWLTCTNRTCDAHLYDIHRGILLHADGHVDRLGV